MDVSGFDVGAEAREMVLVVNCVSEIGYDSYESGYAKRLQYNPVS